MRHHWPGVDQAVDGFGVSLEIRWAQFQALGGERFC